MGVGYDCLMAKKNNDADFNVHLAEAMVGHPPLTVEAMRVVAQDFARRLNVTPLPDLFGVTDGKAVGTNIEHKFKMALAEQYSYDLGNSAHGLDLPSINTDIKVTSIAQPQSSAPFKTSKQVFAGMGYNLIVFVYEKSDDSERQVANLRFRHVVFIDEAHASDYRHSGAVRSIATDTKLDRSEKVQRIVDCIVGSGYPIEDKELVPFAESLVDNPPEVGCITVSPALQYRFGFKPAIKASEAHTSGVVDLV